MIYASSIEAELQYVLNIVYPKYSMNLSTDSGKLLMAVFTDSHIAKSLQCGQTKASSVAIFGLAPFLQNELLFRLSTRINKDKRQRAEIINLKVKGV